MTNLRKIILGAASLAALAVATSASAQASSSATGTASVTILTPINISNTAPLDFGKVVKGAGTATVGTDGSYTGQVTGAVVYAGTASRTAAAFTVTGTSGATVSWTAPSTVAISGIVTPVALSYSWGASAPTTLASASVNFTVGGTLTLVGNETDGAHTGTFNVAVNYN